MEEDGRPISPNTKIGERLDDDDDEQGSTSFSSYFTRLRNSIFKPSPGKTKNVGDNSLEIDSSSPIAPKSVAKLIDDEPLSNNFTSDKKKRLSIQAIPRRGTNPRSPSLSNLAMGSYSNLYTNLRTYEQELNNDLERRISNVYEQEYVKADAISNNPSISRDASPLNVLPLPTHSFMGINSPASDSNVENFDYGSLYTDEQGNLVRPPFIKLDPRERHHLLQLKRTIEAQESIQKRIRYMVDPNETISSMNTTINKVDSATQTHDVEYLSRKLHFKRRVESAPIPASAAAAVADAASGPPLKKRRGFFSGEFKYDVPEESKMISTVPSVSSELNGYLGSITKPKFTKSEPRAHSPLTQIIPQQDEDPTLKKFARSSPSRDRENLFAKSATIPTELKLDDEYLKKSESVSNIIKLKDSVEVNRKITSPVAPSSGFKFDIKKDDLNNILKQRQDNDDLFANSKLVNQKPSFTLKKSVAIENTEDDALKQQKTSTATPSLFGNKDESEQPRKRTRKRSNDEEDQEEKKGSAPLFSFGKPDEKAKAPQFAFKKTENDQPAASAPKFSFGKKPEEAPTSLFTERKESTEAPKFSFGKKDETPKLDGEVPKFTFGAKTESNGSATSAKPLFSFGNKEEAGTSATASPTPLPDTSIPKPAFSFGEKKEESGGFLFGKKVETDAVAKPTSTFEFGKKDETAAKPTQTFEFNKKDDTTKPALSFAFGKKDEEETAVKPASGLFGKKGEDAAKPVSTFSFGKKEEQDTTGKPASTFTFGNKESQGPSLFGATSSTTASKLTETKPSVFMPDKPEQTKTNIFDKSATPPFSFGSTLNKPSGETKVPEKPGLFSQASKESGGFTFGKPAGTEATNPTSSESTNTFKFGSGSAAASAATTTNTSFKFGSATPSGTKDATSTTPSFSFNVDKKVSPDAGNKPFAFGQSQSQSQTANPGFSFGGTNNTSSGFAFSATNNTPSPVPTNPDFKFAAGINPSSIKSPFAFGANTNSTPAAATPNFMFNQQQQQQQQQQPVTSFGQSPLGQSSNSPFGQPPQTASPAFGSQPATTPFSFGGGMQQNGAPGQFNFGVGSKETTPDPASIFKSHAAAFGQAPAMTPGAPGVPFSGAAPGLPGGRPKLVPRSRRR
ncbi:uncharacterized protein SPAPADRAFT_68640 [Spathaspora passalidarum NRRL Y-27907]|uniref:Uncharacterized protein n=1 Tax=Spathaspora passalidarum (strain NRRL Y-27907 / 11-Y1) TaxID=619300 RepID=G3AUK0_SPAPN|nr:uncharacterized protein SPAPADRAFT_68640 [Spathaspora passalidarum NRRL Y-27907]EGW30556.1 hypothetical protein SPAPADRAFT_68640 [Spathaspora passalidarum NRRL Y-27907]